MNSKLPNRIVLVSDKPSGWKIPEGVKTSLLIRKSEPRARLLVEGNLDDASFTSGGTWSGEVVEPGIRTTKLAEGKHAGFVGGFHCIDFAEATAEWADGGLYKGFYYGLDRSTVEGYLIAVAFHDAPSEHPAFGGNVMTDPLEIKAENWEQLAWVRGSTATEAVRSIQSSIDWYLAFYGARKRSEVDEAERKRRGSDWWKYRGDVEQNWKPPAKHKDDLEATFIHPDHLGGLDEDLPLPNGYLLTVQETTQAEAHVLLGLVLNGEGGAVYLGSSNLGKDLRAAKHTKKKLVKELAARLDKGF